MPVSFRDIKSDVLGRLARGAWGPGETLPTEAELSARYGCARATVNRALRELAEEGYLERRRRSGTRVRRAPEPRARVAIPQPRDEVERQGARYTHALLSREERLVPAWLAARLRLAPAAPMLHLVGLHLADGAPFQHEERWINLAALPSAKGMDFARQAPGEWLVATMPYSEVEVGFSAVAASAGQAAALRCARGDPLFQMDRTTWFGGRPVTFVRLCYHCGYRMATRT